MIIAAYAVDCHLALVYIRGEFSWVIEFWKRRSKRSGRGYLEKDLRSNFDLHLRLGAGAYICGEETGLIESLEGKRGHPRQKPPFPAVQGLYGCPTVVNNVETLSNLPHIFNRGVEWFKSIGSNEKNSGPKLYCVSGHVQRPAVVERELGVPLMDLIHEECGGLKPGRKLKA
jgi:NADH-quinone oxidoreductase subunit F